MTIIANYVFPCASVNGLTLEQKRAAIAALRDSIKAERAERKAGAAQRKVERAAAKALKAEQREAKRAAAIEKAKARLQRLLDKQNPVGTAARKAARKPSKPVVTFGAEANAIAAALVAKRKSA